MPTKTKSIGNKVTLESDNVAHDVRVDDDWTGTAIELLRALESTDEEVLALQVHRDIGRPKVTVFMQYGHDGEPAAVPDALHDKLTEYGYEHTGGQNYDHTTDARDHVYKQ